MNESAKFFTNLHPWISRFARFRRNPQQKSTPPRFGRHLLYRFSHFVSSGAGALTVRRLLSCGVASRVAQSLDERRRAQPIKTSEFVRQVASTRRTVAYSSQCQSVKSEARRQFINNDGGAFSSSSSFPRCLCTLRTSTRYICVSVCPSPVVPFVAKLSQHGPFQMEDYQILRDLFSINKIVVACNYQIQ